MVADQRVMLVNTPINEAFDSRSLAGMAALGLGPSYTADEQLAIRILGNTGEYTADEVEWAMSVIYPVQTAGGAPVNVKQIESGEYTVVTDQENEPLYAEYSGPQGDVGPKPELEDIPLYQYIPETGCDPRDMACLERNTQRMEANRALQMNRLAEYRNRIAEHNCQLNTRAGHPELCQSFEPLQPVPSAPGSPVQTAGAYTGEYAGGGAETGIILDNPLPAPRPAAAPVRQAQAGASEAAQVFALDTATGEASADAGYAGSEAPGPSIAETFTEAVGGLDKTTLLIAAAVGAFLLLRK